jgi:TetR/AcrR family transcriptional repressor of nem operon
MPAEKTEISRSNDILAAAELLFRTKGYQATSMSDVAQMCRLGKASLYHHFAGKEELALAVMAKVQAKFDISVFSYAYDETLSSKQRLLKMNNAIKQFFPIETGGCLFANFAIEQINRIPAFEAPIRHYFDSWSTAYTAIFSQAFGAAAARSLADDFVSDLQGALVLMRITGDHGPLRRFFARSLQALDAGLPVRKKVLQAKYVGMSEAEEETKLKTRA